MCRHHTALSCLLRYQVKIIFEIRVLIFNYIGIDKATWRGILQVFLPILYKEPLVNSLVHKYDSDVWFLVSLIVYLINGLLELGDLSFEDLFTH